MRPGFNQMYHHGVEPNPFSRVFLACPLPSSQADEIHSWAKGSLPSSLYRISPPHQLHLTLLFAPKVSGEGVDCLVSAIQRISWPPLTMWSAGLKLLGGRGSALGLQIAETCPVEERLLTRLGIWRPESGAADHTPFAWAEQQGCMLVDLVQEFRRSSARISDVATRSFTPHVTLARLSRPSKLAPELPKPPNVAVTLDRLALYESILHPEGAEHRLLAEARQIP